MGTYAKLAIAALVLLILGAIGYSIKAVHTAGYDSGYSAGESSGKEKGNKEGYAQGLS